MARGKTGKKQNETKTNKKQFPELEKELEMLNASQK